MADKPLQCLCVLCKHEWKIDASSPPPTMACPGCHVQALTQEFLRAAREQREKRLARMIMTMFMVIVLPTAGILGYVYFGTPGGAVAVAAIALACVGVAVVEVKWPWLLWWFPD